MEKTFLKGLDVNPENDLRELARREGFKITNLGYLKSDRIFRWYVVELESPEKGKKEFQAVSEDEAIKRAIDFLLKV
jgi:tRNA(Phe) wybutosine-synthesizing methylase Tyw3